MRCDGAFVFGIRFFVTPLILSHKERFTISFLQVLIVLLTQTEEISFIEASTRSMAMNEVLIGYVERGTRKTVLNPPDKKAIIMSHASVHALLTIAGPNHIRKRG